MKDFKGKIVQVDLFYQNEKEAKKHVGVILDQEPYIDTDETVITLLEKSGEEISFKATEAELDQMLHAVRLSSDERAEYGKVFKIYSEHAEILSKIDETKKLLFELESTQRSLKYDYIQAKSALSRFSETLTPADFAKALEELISKKLDYLDLYVACKTENCFIGNSNSPVTLVIEDRVDQDKGRYFDITRLPFAWAEYDGQLFFEREIDEKAYDAFCNRNCKSVKELDMLYEKTQELYPQGNRNGSYVGTITYYHVPLSKGFTRSSLKQIEADLDKVLSRNTSIDEKIKTAQGKQKAEPKSRKTKKLEQEQLF